jgi:hypothetical protein
MKDTNGTFNILASIEKHIEGLKPLLPKQAIVGIGEYPIKVLLKEPILGREGALPIFVEKSSDDIYKWIPKGFDPHLILGFEDYGVDTHFWYDVLPVVIRDRSLTDSLKRPSAEKIRGAIILGAVSNGVASAAIPSFTTKFRKQNIDSLSIAVMPSKIQPVDAHFNAYAMLQMCQQTEGAVVLLIGRDQLESFEGVDKKGEQIKGNNVLNYIIDMFLSKELLVQEVSELSRTFNIKLFSALVVTAASYKVYGSLKNMLDMALLEPLSPFDISSASLLYVLLRMPTSLKETIPKAKIELEITNWFKEKTNLQSIHISEPIYTEEANDRIDAVLFIGGFNTVKMFAELEEQVSKLKKMALEKGLMTEDWKLPFKVEEEVPMEVPKQEKNLPLPPESVQPIPIEQQSPPIIETSQTIQKVLISPTPKPSLVSEDKPVETATIETAEQIPLTIPERDLKPKKPKRILITKKVETKIEENPPAEITKPKRTRRTKARREQKSE